MEPKKVRKKEHKKSTINRKRLVTEAPSECLRLCCIGRIVGRDSLECLEDDAVVGVWGEVDLLCVGNLPEIPGPDDWKGAKATDNQ